MNEEYVKMYAQNPQLIGREQLAIYVPLQSILNAMKEDDAFESFLLFYNSYDSVDDMNGDAENIPVNRVVIIKTGDDRGDVYKKTEDGLLYLYNILGPYIIDASIDDDYCLSLKFNNETTLRIEKSLRGPIGLPGEAPIPGKDYLTIEQIEAYIDKQILGGEW